MMLTSPSPSKKFRHTFADYQTLDEPALVEAKSAAEAFVESAIKHGFDGEGFTLTFAGVSGTGKTMLTSCIMNELGLDAWRVCRRIKSIITGGKLIHAEGIVRDWRKVSDVLKGGNWSIVESLEAPLVLVIDDIGADHDPSTMGVSKLDRVLRARKGKWTVITSNLTVSQIAEKLDTRIASFLIRDDNRVVNVEACDYALR